MQGTVGHFILHVRLLFAYPHCIWLYIDNIHNKGNLNKVHTEDKQFGKYMDG